MIVWLEEVWKIWKQKLAIPGVSLGEGGGGYPQLLWGVRCGIFE